MERWHNKKQGETKKDNKYMNNFHNISDIPEIK